MATGKLLDVKSHADNPQVRSVDVDITSTTQRRGFLRCNIKRNLLSMTALAVACMTSGQVDAAVVNVTQGSTSGYTMTDGNTYVIKNSVSFSNSTAGGSGMSVKDGATVVLYVPAGITLTAKGADGSGQTGGGAGIRVPETSTLVITGEGMVNTTGGNAGNGADGNNGENGVFENHGYGQISVNGGNGGSGGAGGGGAGAGIGGCGGVGGIGGIGEYPSGTWPAHDDEGGTLGATVGGNGGNAESMGTVYVIGAIIVSATTGQGGVPGRKGSTGLAAYGEPDGKYVLRYEVFGGGGGGGGGGAGSPPIFSIGGGGSSGGGGASGAEGLYRESNSRPTTNGVYGRGGRGGESATRAGENANNSYKNGGTAGSEGHMGVLYVSPTATVNVDRDKLSAITHPMAQYTVTLDTNGGEFLSPVNPIITTLGCELPEDIPTPHKGVAKFLGWAYDRDGDLMCTVYTKPLNSMLYAAWEPLCPVFTPETGTIFDNSLSISISCLAEGATIHYTTDGSEPTVDSPVYRRFRINGKTTVKAIAEEDGLLSDVVTAEYALGQCEDPVIMPGDGATFAWAGEQVSIGWHGEDGVLRYTTDGSDPTPESPVYEGPFMISDSTIVKAKAFGNQFFDSAIVTANITRVWTDVATPQIDTRNSFTGSKTKVVISCATEGTTIRYTLDGSEPNSHSTKYSGPFYVTDSCTVRAYAVKYDYRNSAVATQEIVKVWGIGDTMGKSDHWFTTDGTGGVGWMRVVDATAPNGEAMKSGAITHEQSTVLSTMVVGPGRLTFSWRTSCEDSGGAYDWDHIEFAVDGVVRLRCDGETPWTKKTVRITGDGEHTVTWTYVKDDVESAGEDAAWVAGYGWTADYTETKTTAVSVPYAWLLQLDPEIVDEFDAYEAAAKEVGENGYMLWESYVIGVNPNDRNDVLRITSFSMKEDGTLDLDSVEVSPAKSQWKVQNATLALKGKVTLDDGEDWQPVTEENKAQFRFFKAEVVLP